MPLLEHEPYIAAIACLMQAGPETSAFCLLTNGFVIYSGHYRHALAGKLQV